MSMEYVSFAAAILGLLVAAMSLGWQVCSWIYDGRRVRVALVHGVLGQTMVAAGRVGRDRKPRPVAPMRQQGFTGSEVIGIAVTNVGRAPVRIDRYSAGLVRGGMSLSPVGNAIGPALPFRLPPGETETWYAHADDARALIEATRSIGRAASLHVYMSVELGTGDTVRARRTIQLGSGR